MDIVLEFMLEVVILQMDGHTPIQASITTASFLSPVNFSSIHYKVKGYNCNGWSNEISNVTIVPEVTSNLYFILNAMALYKSYNCC